MNEACTNERMLNVGEQKSGPEFAKKKMMTMMNKKRQTRENSRGTNTLSKSILFASFLVETDRPTNFLDPSSYRM